MFPSQFLQKKKKKKYIYIYAKNNSTFYLTKKDENLSSKIHREITHINQSWFLNTYWFLSQAPDSGDWLTRLATPRKKYKPKETWTEKLCVAVSCNSSTLSSILYLMQKPCLHQDLRKHASCTPNELNSYIHEQLDVNLKSRLLLKYSK